MTTRRAGFHINEEASDALRTMSFVLKRSQSELVELGIRRVAEGLSPGERRAFDAARAANSGR